MPTCRTAILAATSSPHVAALLPATQAIVESNGTCVGTFEPNDTLPEGLDRLVVIGGDGTMLAAIRGSLGTGIPVLGVNAGRLGVLAQFDIESLRNQADAVFSDTPLVREHLVLAVEVFDASGERKLSSAAVNDCVLTAGAPFRMIELHMHLDGVEGPVLNGDGVIVSTPIGSTAYNVSAGGPILQPSIEAFAITPVAPHSLACRPIVASAETKIMFEISRANAGTTLVLDGQINHPIQIGDRIEVRANPQRALLLGNADSPYWRTLIDKMRWAAPPTYRDRGP